MERLDNYNETIRVLERIVIRNPDVFYYRGRLNEVRQLRDTLLERLGLDELMEDYELSDTDDDMDDSSDEE